MADQHRRSEAIRMRAERDQKKHGVLPLGEAKCDECDVLAYTRWYADKDTRHETVAYTLCAAHNDEMIARSTANRKRLGLA